MKFRLLLTILTLLSLPVTGRAQQPEPSFSPDRRYRLDQAMYEMKMSHWVYQPSLTRMADHLVVLAPGSLWSLDSHRWLSSDRLEIVMRRYPGGHPGVKVEVRLDSNQFRFANGQLHPLPALNRWLDQGEQ